MQNKIRWGIIYFFFIFLIRNQQLKELYTPYLISFTWDTPLSTQGYQVNDKSFAGELTIKAEAVRDQFDLLRERDERELYYKRPYWELSISERPAFQK